MEDLDPTVLEAIGIREALSWLNRNRCSISIFGMIIADCIKLLSETPSCRILYVRRSTNQIAHTLARAFVSMSGSSVWCTTSPSFFYDILKIDD